MDAARARLAGDASKRRYERLTRGGAAAILMDAPPAEETAACPPDADERTRRDLGYNAMARLAGPNLDAFLSVAEELRGLGFSAPETYAADPDAGFALLEDLGDNLFARAIPAGARESDLYRAAVALLARLHASPPREMLNNGWRLQHYDRLALETEIELLLDWYLPHVAGGAPGAEARRAFLSAWAQPLDRMAASPRTLVLRDYHAENLIWLPERAGLARIGLLDFQDAVLGPDAYDLVSLLEDARRDVAPALAAELIEQYCSLRRSISPDFDADRFCTDYAICGAQRNTKIIGIFMRLAHRDGKTQYLRLMDRVLRHLICDLRCPALDDVRAWHDEFAPLGEAR
ncbi:MAG: phosphotransferase [Parvularculaceae bacterium]